MIGENNNKTDAIFSFCFSEFTGQEL